MDDRPGIIAELAGILAAKQIGLEAVLQLPCDTKHDLPFVITVGAIFRAGGPRGGGADESLEFLREPPLALPMEPPL